MQSRPDPSLALLTYQSLLRTFSSFLTVAIHTILYERAIYPASTFISTRAYNFPVRQNRHPQVCKWINDAVSAVEAQMRRGAVRNVAVVIYAPTTPSTSIMERFLFDVSRFPSVPEREIYTTFETAEGGTGSGKAVEGEGEEDGPLKNPQSIVDIEEQLRATVRKLAYCGFKLGSLPDNCSFTVAVELKEQAEPPIGNPQPWVPSEPSLQVQKKHVGRDVGGVRTMPVRAVEAGEFVLESWVEEGADKEGWKERERLKLADEMDDDWDGS